MSNFDVDIDVMPTLHREGYGVRAIIYNEPEKKIQPHPSGMYVDTNMPVDCVTGWAAIDYETAESVGYIKIDLLSNSTYTKFKTKGEILNLMDKEPDWNLLLNEKVVKKLPHLKKHHKLLCMIRPSSVEELADVLALIRPGKSQLIDKYQSNKLSVRTSLYRRPLGGGAYFKRSHAIAYALMIVVLLNSLEEKKLVSF